MTTAARVLVARLDSDGDVLLAGPAIRAAAAGWRGRPSEVTLLCGPAGAQAAGLLPGVSRTLRWNSPWIAADPEPLRPARVRGLIDTVPAVRWAPYRVPHVLLGDQDAPCKETRARACPVPGHPCLSSVTAADVTRAADALVGVVV